MKKHYLVLLSSALALLAGCSSEKPDAPDGPDSDSGKAYMSISLAGTKSPSGRAGDNPGTNTGDEDYVHDVRVLYFDANNLFLGASEKINRAELASATAPTYKTKALEVPGDTKKVFVIVNNEDNSSTSADRFTVPGKSDIGRPWSALNQTFSFTPTAVDGVNEFRAKYTGTKDGQSNFFMANAGVRKINGVINTADNGLVSVTTAKTPEAAAATPNIVAVDRLVSKVEFKIVSSGGGQNQVAAEPAGASFFFNHWEMTATNRKMRLYAEHDANYTQADENGANVAYRKDANYTLASYGTPAATWSEYAKEFVYLTNIGTDGSTGRTTPFTKVADKVEYCPENTMEAEAQVIGATTKVIVEGNYVPPTFNANDNYFTYEGQYYTLAQIKQAYADAVAATTTGGIVADMNAFMKAAGLALSTDDNAAIAIKVAALAEASFDANTGIMAREANAVRFFYSGISYYEVLIRHDARVTDNMALGKYGAVRNNWYTLTLNSVSREGTPWIPGGPDDPITPPSKPDDNTALLEVTINVQPWVTWNQIVDL